ncbi:TIGR04149 family rSAM-modified RiPP [Bacteroides pyogenes]|nr:rSAM-modified peptide [Bacteroides pyogenes]
MKLRKFNLNKLAGNSLANREMKEIKGGKCCRCSCAYVNTGGSNPKG